MLKKMASLMGLTLLLQACEAPPQKIHTVAQVKTTTPLFLNSTIEPLSVLQVATPIDGLLKELHFVYGEIVKKGEVLVCIFSEALDKEYRDVVSNYIKQQELWHNKQLEFKGTRDLYESGIKSDNEFRSEETAYNNAYLSFLDAKWKLNHFSKRLGQSDIETAIKTMNVRDEKSLSELLNKRADTLCIHAPKTGVVLRPLRKDDTADDPFEGAQLKAGDALLTIGDMSGLTMEAHVDEIHIRRIQTGQPVQVTSAANPELNLQGQIVEVSHQAIQQSDALTFPVRVIVTEWSHQKAVYVGMSVTLKLLFKNPLAIRIPIEFIHRCEKTRRSCVSRLDEEGHAREISVMTGETGVRQVTIHDGLKVGDRLIEPD